VREALQNPQAGGDGGDGKAIALPLLVITYTNHALDQFLEGLLDKVRTRIRNPCAGTTT
jgi:hypothetical protein